MVHQNTILIVEDTVNYINYLSELLRDSYKIRIAVDGKTAIKIANNSNPPDLILQDIGLPDLSGYDVCRSLKSYNSTKNIPIIFLTGRSEIEDEALGLSLGAVDFITKPFNPDLVKSRIHNHIELKNHRDSLEELVKARTKELELTQEVTIDCMAATAEYRDPETGGHIKRIQKYVKILAEKLINHPNFKDYLNPRIIESLYLSSPLHDIGKVGIRDDILLKPGKLTDEEFKIMEQHTVIGRDAIAVSIKNLPVADSFLKYAMEIAISHHEKWNGTGYPYGLRNNEIPIPGRLMAVADVYDALISRRVYKPPFSHEKALAIIKDGRGEHFDPDIVDAFVQIEDQFRKVALEYSDRLYPESI
jgi:putative two-component system response regulator